MHSSSPVPRPLTLPPLGRTSSGVLTPSLLSQWLPGQRKTNLESPNSQPLFLCPLHSPTYAERDWNRLAQPEKSRAAEGEAMKDGRKSGQPQVLSSRHGASSHGWQAAHRPLGYTGRGTRARNLCEAEGRESFCSLCAAPLLWRKGTQQCWCVLSSSSPVSELLLVWGFWGAQQCLREPGCLCLMSPGTA